MIKKRVCFLASIKSKDMKEFKGTKGEWILETVKGDDGEISEIYILQEGGGCIICINDGDDAYDIPTDLANAKLVSQSPNLLKALQNIIDACDGNNPEHAIFYFTAQEAINKAI